MYVRQVVTMCLRIYNYTQVKFARRNVRICCCNMKFAKAKQCQNIRQKTCQTTCQTTCQSICQYSPKRCYNVLQLIFRICARVLPEYMPDVMSDFMSAKTFFCQNRQQDNMSELAFEWMSWQVCMSSVSLSISIPWGSYVFSRKSKFWSKFIEIPLI